MTHPRTLIREGVAIELVNKGVDRNKIFVSRIAPIEHKSLPAICVYTKSERTEELLTDEVFNQTLELVIEIYVKRKPNMIEPFDRIEGMANNPAQTNNADRHLDCLCKTVEDVVFNYLFRADVKVNDECVYVHGITAISTEIDGEGDASIPLLKARLSMSVKYQRQPDVIDDVSCPFKLFYFDIDHVACNEDDPLNGEVAISGRQDLEGG